MARKSIVSFALFLMALAILGHVIPINDFGWTIPKTSGLCDTDLRGFGKSFSENTQQTCPEMKYITLGIYGFGIIGTILLIVCALIPSKSKKSTKFNENRK